MKPSKRIREIAKELEKGDPNLNFDIKAMAIYLDEQYEKTKTK